MIRQSFIVTEFLLADLDAAVVGDFVYEVDNGVILIDEINLDRVYVFIVDSGEKVSPSERLLRIIRKVVECVVEEWDGGPMLGTDLLQFSAMEACERQRLGECVDKKVAAA